jgi:hypothetical protein
VTGETQISGFGARLDRSSLTARSKLASIVHPPEWIHNALVRFHPQQEGVMRSRGRSWVPGPEERGVLRRAAERCAASCLLVLGSDTHGRAPERLEDAAFDLAAFLARVYIPAVGSAGHWPVATEGAARFLQRVGRACDCEQHPGHGARARTYLRLLAVPVLWALISAHPQLQECALLDAGRADRLRYAWSVSTLFATLGRFAELPPGVHFAAGVLAAVARPPAMGAWIETARQAARSHGAREFVRFFTRVVTNA